MNKRQPLASRPTRQQHGKAQEVDITSLQDGESTSALSSVIKTLQLELSENNESKNEADLAKLKTTIEKLDAIRKKLEI